MASKQWYEHVTGDEQLRLITDPIEYDKALDTARLAVVVEQQAQSDAARSDDAGARGLSLEEYDAAREAENWELNARLLYYDFPTKVVNLTVKDGDWFTPEAVESFCGEEVGNEASQSVDGTNTTVWKHAADEEHEIVYRLRSFPLKISKIRFRYNATEPLTEQLSAITVSAARALANIDEPDKILEEDINITWPVGAGAVWVERVLASKAPSVRYIKLAGFGSAHASNTIQVREFAVFVETRDP